MSSTILQPSTNIFTSINFSITSIIYSVKISLYWCSECWEATFLPLSLPIKKDSAQDELNLLVESIADSDSNNFDDVFENNWIGVSDGATGYGPIDVHAGSKDIGVGATITVDVGNDILVVDNNIGTKLDDIVVVDSTNGEQLDNVGLVSINGGTDRKRLVVGAWLGNVIKVGAAVSVILLTVLFDDGKELGNVVGTWLDAAVDLPDDGVGIELGNVVGAWIVGAGVDLSGNGIELGNVVGTWLVAQYFLLIFCYLVSVS